MVVCKLTVGVILERVVLILIAMYFLNFFIAVFEARNISFLVK